MQNLLVYTTKEHKGFMDEWQPHRNCSDFWSIYSILKDETPGGSVYAFCITIRQIRIALDSFCEVFCSLTDVTHSRTWEQRYLVPHVIRNKHKELYFDHNSFFCGDRVQILFEGDAVAVRIDLGELHLDICAEATTPTQWAGETGGLQLKNGLKSTTTLMSSWTPYLHCVGKLWMRETERPLRLEGTGAFERLWGIFPTANAKVHWEKFYVFLDNNTEFVVLDFPYGKQKYNVGFRMEPEKDISPLSSFELRAVDFLEIDEWRFGSGWRLEISDEEPLYLVPLIREQFVMAVPRPLLGIYDQEGKQLGYGFSELTPGARNELRRIPLRVYYKYWKADVL